MNSLILVHLGESVPLYIKDCVHQLRLLNPPNELKIYIVLESFHTGNPFWSDIVGTYSATIVYTNTLEPTPDHILFRKNFRGDTKFRNGYWRHVKERFFYMEELMLQEGLENVVAMEYDIMVYANLKELIPKLKEHSKGRLPMVMDNESRGHPGFLFLESARVISSFNCYMLQMVKTQQEDMQLLSSYSKEYEECVCFLPLISPERNASIPQRKSKEGHTSQNTSFLSDGFDTLNCVFDSLVVGQALGGIDPRNVGGRKMDGYENESALYSMKELTFKWRRVGNLWQPILDGHHLVTIHMHSKALYPFFSDRVDIPKADYNVDTLYRSLDPN